MKNHKELTSMEKTKLNSLYGVMADKYIDTDLNSIYPNDNFVVSLDTICEKLMGKIHATVTYYLSILDEQVKFSERHAAKADRKEQLFYHIALDTHSCYDVAINTIFEISNLLIPVCMRYGEAYEKFLHELTKYRNIGGTMLKAIYTIDSYKKFALEVRKSLLE